MEDGLTLKREKISSRIKLWSVLLIAIIVSFVAGGCGSFSLPDDLDKAIEKSASFVYENTSEPISDAIGGEWAVKGVLESGINHDEDFVDSYYKNLVKKLKNESIANETYSQYARMTIGVQAIGKSATDIDGFNIVELLDNYEKVTGQGVTAVAYALIASKEAGVTLKNEDKYIDYILHSLRTGEHKDDVFSSDYTSICLEALSFYVDRKDVKTEVDNGISYLSKFQKDDGGMGNCDSTAECIIALNQCKVDILKDERFIKNGKSLGDALMEYMLKDGSFKYVKDLDKTNGMSTEKSLLAMIAMKRGTSGKTLFQEKKR